MIRLALEECDTPTYCKHVRFETLRVDEHNKRAVSIMQSWARDIWSRKQGVFLYGGAGTGKTWLTVAAMHLVIESGQLISQQPYPQPWRTYLARYVSMPEWLEAQRPGRSVMREDAMETAQKAVLLVMDDIGVENPTDWARERIYTALNYRYERMLPTLFTSNHNLDELAGRLTDRIASRITEMCVQVELSGPDRRSGTRAYDPDERWWIGDDN